MSTSEEFSKLMRMALDEADAASKVGEVPVGAVIIRPAKSSLPAGALQVEGFEVLATAHNERETSGDPTAHAEVLALRRAAEKLGRWNLSECLLIVTLEPCLMCAGAAINSRVDTIVYGANDPKAGACDTLYNVCQDERLNHNPKIISGIHADESAAQLKAFFKSLRK